MINMLNRMSGKTPSHHLPLGNQRHEAFCRLYATNQECFGNGTRDYVAAYGIDMQKKGAANSARASASKLLKNAIILARISFLLDSGFSDLQSDKQLAFLVAQNADLKVKIAAIKEYNALRGRIQRKLAMDFSYLSDNELGEELNKIDQEIMNVQAT
ncbi:MAG: hypothetical protein PHH57_05830 [Candidatus Omnitrophica bacterium]|nr:hypothetical protein [Candidatus Omnitrophota bacterium]